MQITFKNIAFAGLVVSAAGAYLTYSDSEPAKKIRTQAADILPQTVLATVNKPAPVHPPASPEYCYKTALWSAKFMDIPVTLQLRAEDRLSGKAGAPALRAPEVDLYVNQTVLDGLNGNSKLTRIWSDNTASGYIEDETLRQRMRDCAKIVGRKLMFD